MTFDFIEKRDDCPVCGNRHIPTEETRIFRGTKFSWSRCSCCRLFFQNPRLTIQSIKTAYESTDYFGLSSKASDSAYKHYVSTDRLRISHSIERLKKIAKVAGIVNGRLLDVGSATGFFGVAARDTGFDVTCLEPSLDMAAYGRDVYNLDFRVGTIEEVDVEKGAYDMVTLWGTDSHFTEIMPSFRKLCSALKPGGAFAMNFQDFDHWIKVIFPDLKIGWNVMFNLTTKTFGKIMSDCGMKIIYRGLEWQSVPVAQVLRFIRWNQPEWSERLIFPVPAISIRMVIARRVD